MKNYRTFAKTIPLLIASGLLLSACATYPEPYTTTAYACVDPGYDCAYPDYVDPGVGFGWFGGGDHGFDHGFHDHGFHGGRPGGFAHAGGFGHGGGFHGGGFHGGGGGHVGRG